jgi:hypothetical protein
MLDHMDNSDIVESVLWKGVGILIQVVDYIHSLEWN